MTVSPVGRGGTVVPGVARVAMPKPALAKDADGDRDGTKPGRVDMRDRVVPAHTVDVRA